MAIFQILTKVLDGRKIGINIDCISYIEDLEDCTKVVFDGDQEIEVEETIEDMFPNSDTPKQRDKKTPFIPIKLSSN